MPLDFRVSTISSSLIGLCGCSFSINFLILNFTAAEDCELWSSFSCKLTLKKDFSSRVPCGVSMRDPVVTRLIVLSCMSTASATSRRIMG